MLTDIDMLLVVEKEIMGGIVHLIHRYAKANNKYIKIYDKTIESSYLEYLDANNLYGSRMSQRLPVKGLKRIKNVLKFDEEKKNYDEDSDKGYVYEANVEYPKNYMICIVIYHF